MSAFKVTELHGTGAPWSTKDGRGPFTPHRFSVEGEGRTVEWSRREGSPGPAVGDVLTGELEDRGERFPLKFKRAQQPGGPPSGGQGRSPERERSIVRQHSQEMALRWMAIQAARGRVPEDFRLDGLRALIDWFARDAAS